MQDILLQPNNIDEPWKAVFEIAQSPELIFIPPSFSLTKLEALDQGLERSNYLWIMGLHWLYKKKWNRSHRIPCSPKLAERIAPIGDYFWAITELASEVHLLGHPLSRQWDNAGSWTGAILKEIRDDEINNGIRQMLSGDGKDTTIAKARDFLKVLKDECNPCDKLVQPSYWALVEGTVEILKTKKLPNFRQRHWISPKTQHIYTSKGLIGSISRCIKRLESSEAQAMKIKNNSLFVRKKGGDVCIKRV